MFALPEQYNHNHAGIAGHKRKLARVLVHGPDLADVQSRQEHVLQVLQIHAERAGRKHAPRHADGVHVQSRQAHAFLEQNNHNHAETVGHKPEPARRHADGVDGAHAQGRDAFRIHHNRSHAGIAGRNQDLVIVHARGGIMVHAQGRDAPPLQHNAAEIQFKPVQEHAHGLIHRTALL